MLIIYSYENLRGTLENHEKHKSLAWWIFPRLCYVNVCLSVMFIFCIAMCGCMHVYMCVLLYSSSIILLHFKYPMTCVVFNRKLRREETLPNLSFAKFSYYLNKTMQMDYCRFSTNPENFLYQHAIIILCKSCFHSYQSKTTKFFTMYTL